MENTVARLMLNEISSTAMTFISVAASLNAEGEML